MGEGSLSAVPLRAFWVKSQRLAVIVIAVAAPLLYCLHEQGKALALGWLLGGTASILRYRLHYRVLMRLLRVEGTGGGILVRTRLLTYLLSGAALAAAFCFRAVISPWTTIAGLFVMNVCVIVTELSESLATRGGGAAPRNGS